MPSGAFNERRAEDIKKIKNLAQSSKGLIKITDTSGNPINRIVIELGYKTASDKNYPKNICTNSIVNIDLPARYPFQEPKAIFKTKVFHPNVYQSGLICFGEKWIPTQGLDLLVKRIIQIITFDISILNEKSPANGDALSWYKKTSKKNASFFPTQSVSFSSEKAKRKISWTDKSAKSAAVSNEKVLIKCPSCSGKLRVPSGKKGNIKCPHCGHSFGAST